MKTLPGNVKNIFPGGNRSKGITCLTLAEDAQITCIFVLLNKMSINDTIPLIETK